MTATPAAFVGVVPGAGASRRMGRSKALLEIEGRTFLSRVVSALLDGGCSSVLVVVAEGDVPVANEARAAGARVLANPDPGEGPITSLRLAIREIGDGGPSIVYLPVDHPLVRPETVEAVLAAATSSGAPLTLPMHGPKRGHPAVFSPDLFAELADPSLEGGARIVVHRHLADACLLDTDDPGVIADIDTPDAYAALLAARGDE